MEKRLDKNDKIFVAGSSGLVGSAIVRYLISNGYDKIYTNKINLMDDLQTESLFDRYGFDYVFLAAAKVGGIKANAANPVSFFENNILIQNNVIKSSFNNKVKKLIFFGSSCIYPKNCPQPIKEEYLMTGRLEPTNEAYALAKISGIKLLDYYYQEYGFESLKVMPCNLYGINDKFDENGHVMAGLIKKFCDSDQVTIWGDGTARREFLWVDDFVNILMKLIEVYNSQDIINVGSGYDLSIKELVELIIENMEWKGVVRFDPNKPKGVHQKLLDITKLKNIISHTNILSVDEGIENMIKIYKEQNI